VALAVLALVVFGGAGVVTLWFAATTRDGPILVELSATHGIHRGDVIVGVATFAAAAALVALAALATARDGAR
jgi:hypothetical protein